MKSKSSNQSIGKWGETEACRYLEQKGYWIVERNFRTRAGEIDIICWEIADEGSDHPSATLVFIEVKTRRDFSHGVPSLSVTYAKRKHLLAAARYYAHCHGLEEVPMRYDVVELLNLQGKSYVRQIKNAFN